MAVVQSFVGLIELQRIDLEFKEDCSMVRGLECWNVEYVDSRPRREILVSYMYCRGAIHFRPSQLRSVRASTEWSSDVVKAFGARTGPSSLYPSASQWSLLN